MAPIRRPLCHSNANEVKDIVTAHPSSQFASTITGCPAIIHVSSLDKTTDIVHTVCIDESAAAPQISGIVDQ